MTGSPLHLPHDVSWRDFIRLSAAVAAAGILLPSTKPVAAQTMTSSERELLLLAIGHGLGCDRLGAWQQNSSRGNGRGESYEIAPGNIVG